MEINKEETFLARWMNNELSPSELEAFQKHRDYALYEKIVSKSEKLAAPPYDKNKLLGKVQNKIKENKKPKQKIRSIYTSISIAIAASVAIFLGIFYFANTSTIHSTGFGEQLAVNLPDGSKVILNAKSTVKYNEKEWDRSRTINLTGEAYFKVKKGSKFTVHTALGDVQVLGTEFNVNLDQDFIEVQCFEGKVLVISKNKEIYLTQGKGFRAAKSFAEEWEFTAQQPSWQHGESTFTSVPLQYVVDAIAHQYNVTIITKDIDVNQRFTGVFTHGNLKVALETVFAPLKIQPKFVDKDRISLVKE
ncbi:FecR family protein [Tenacibaculum amylolyticum]|uniref:FecR family protein n=1 Tax=Tenacibaculum amylolyticum TaxID=104269 RepID=UPI003896534F